MRRRNHVHLTVVVSLVVLCSCQTKTPVAQPVVPPSKRLLGISAGSDADFSLVKSAGIQWVRLDFRFPFEDRIGGKLSGDFLKNLSDAQKVSGQGMRIMGITPLAGGWHYYAKLHKFAWHSGIPDWAGPSDSNSYYDTYEKACAELARQTTGIVQMWQVGNEMDADGAGPLSIAQIERFLLAGAHGLKAANPQLKVDINPAFIERHEEFRPTPPGLSGERLFRDLYSQPDTPFDYAGIDGYLGSFQPGGPQDWVPIIEKIHSLTGKPVLINEWGYSSKEGSGKALEQKVHDPVCDHQKWNNSWGKGHTLEEQAAYVQMALKIFATYPDVVGCFYFDWADSPVCPICGRKDCPRETGWGLVDTQGKPKPDYAVFKSVAQEFFGGVVQLSKTGVMQ